MQTPISDAALATPKHTEKTTLKQVSNVTAETVNTSQDQINTSGEKAYTTDGQPATAAQKKRVAKQNTKSNE